MEACLSWARGNKGDCLLSRGYSGATLTRNNVEKVGALGGASMALGKDFAAQQVKEYSPVLSVKMRATAQENRARPLINARA